VKETITLFDRRALSPRFLYPSVQIITEPGQALWDALAKAGFPANVYSIDEGKTRQQRRAEKRLHDKEHHKATPALLPSKPVSRHFSDHVDLSREYRRIHDIVSKVAAFDRALVSAHRYKENEDLASEIFEKLLARGFWDKWNPSRASLSTYTYMGVSSLIKNMQRLKKSRNDASKKFTDIHEDMVMSTNDDDGSSQILDVVSTAYCPEREVVGNVLEQQFLKLLSGKSTGVPGVTYMDVYSLLELKVPLTDRAELLGTTRAICSRLVGHIQYFYKQFMGEEVAA
jgi:DNA-directed RNA polymerase specialized sigma24 family protein